MLNWADLVLLGLVAVSSLVGVLRGFIVEVMSLVVWVAAFWLAFAFGAQAGELFDSVVEAPSARLFLGHAVLFLAALVAGGLTTWLIGRLVKSTGLSGTDRLLGLVFGLLRGAALGCVLVLVLGFTPVPQDPWWRESRLIPGFQGGAEWMRTWLPDAVARHIRYDALPLSLPEAAGAANSGDNTPPSE